ncbi:MAG TPA: RNA methyltransferase [Actinomycetota bacterium]|nr:RNA methyltransferase [Actinomycetota bacterium]
MQAARKLLRRAGRLEAGAFLVEGPRAIGDALRAGAGVRSVFVAADGGPRDVEVAAAAAGVAVTRVPRRVLAALCDTVTPQGAVAVVDAPPAGLPALPPSGSLFVVLADVRDPGNAGTLVRSAAAARADAVVFARGSVDPLHPKAVRASAGSLLALPLVREVSLEETLGALRARGVALVGADAAGAPADETDLVRPLALVLGNEAWGLPGPVRARTDELVSVPMPGGVESLNVGIAGAILLFEAVRQRRRAGVVPPG